MHRSSCPSHYKTVCFLKRPILHVLAMVFFVSTIALGAPRPKISNVTAGAVSTSSATVTWNTNVGATGMVQYGFTSGYGSNSPKNTSYVKSHSITLSGLQAGATYHYRVISSDSRGRTVTSADHTFSIPSAQTSDSGGSTSGTDTSSTSTTSGAVPARYFGIHMWSQSLPSWPNIGFRTQRLWDAQVAWNSIETSRGSFNWSKLDTWINLAQQHNVELLYTFGKTPSWANSTGNSTKPPDNMKDWDDFVRAIVTHAAGRIKVWEVWNEPNATNFWTGSNAQLVTMAQHAYNIIKSVDPNAIVLTPAPQGSSAYQWMDGYFAAGGAPYADAVSFHGYINPTNVEANLNTLISNMRNVMGKYGQQQKPLWNTEASWGQNSNYPDYTLEATVTARMYLLQYPRVARFYWYGWDMQTWGTLWWWTGGIRPAGVAYGQVHNWMAGNTMTPCSASGSVWTCKITRPDGSTGLVVWNASGSSSFATSYIHKHTISGAVSTVSGGSVTITNSPVLLDNN